MDPKEYIQSGLLEQYVLGGCSLEQMQEVECMARVFPEVKAEIAALETAMHNYVNAHAQPAPAHLKEKILAHLNNTASPVEQKPEGKTIAFKPTKTQTWLYTAAACIATLVVTYFIFGNARTERDRLTNVVEIMKAEGEEQKLLLEDAQNMMAIMSDSNTTKVTMKGQQISPQSYTTVYWHRKSNKVYLTTNNLPKPAAGKQYQLWAIADGAPVDLGVFNVNEDTAINLQGMKAITNAQAFAITLEKEGGSPSPTLEMMYVMGVL
ncbi:MAG: anti-sigma factor [Bacteroidetes bacterium]|nr:anti-sigma factor [Bacteroidota bacterium]